MDNKKNQPKSLVMIVFSMLIFGTIGIFRKYIPLSSALISASRGLIGGLFILAFTMLAKGGIKEKLTVRQFLWLALTGAFIGVNWILLFEAFNYTTVAVATLCYYMQPTIVVLMSPIIFKEKLTAKKAICAITAILGMALVSGVIGGLDLQSGNIRGILLGLGAAFFYSVVVIMNKKISGVDTYQKTIIQLLSAGIVMIPYLFLTGGFSNDGFSAKTILLLLILGILHTGIAYLLYFGSMDGLKTQSIAILSYIDPVSTLLFSALFLKETLSIPGIIGAVMIIGSAIISETSIKNQKIKGEQNEKYIIRKRS